MSVTSTALEVFLSAPPGLEPVLREEAAALGLPQAQTGPGGVTFAGTWHDVWRANLLLRGASRVLVRLGSFRAAHLSELEKRARRLPWEEVLSPATPLIVEAVCRRSRIYHSGAAAERVRNAAFSAGAVKATDAQDAVTVMVRIERDICTVSIDTSGDLLHRRGYKQAVGKAPLRETMGALFLRAAGFDGSEPVVDPMCGSGTFVIEAAGWAANQPAGAHRRFAFERLASFDEDAWQHLRTGALSRGRQPLENDTRYRGSDRDPGAIRMAAENAARAGIASWTTFSVADIIDAVPGDIGPGLVMVNPPYGARIGATASLGNLYRSIGRVLKERFKGWRMGLVTSEAALARATGLPFDPPGAPVPHGPIRVRLYKTGPL